MCKNYRGIEKRIDQFQSGFWRNKSVIGQIFTLKYFGQQHRAELALAFHLY